MDIEKIKLTSLTGVCTYQVNCVDVKGSRCLKSMRVTLEISGVFLGIIPPYFFLIAASCKYLAKSHIVKE